MKHNLSKFLAAPLLAFAAACGGGDDEPNWAAEIDAETAAGLGDNAAGFASEIATNMVNGQFLEISLVKGTETPSPAERVLARIRHDALIRANLPGLAAAPSPFRVSATCEPVETGLDEFGDWIDSDDDGIPDDYRLTFPSGCTEIDGAYTITYSGSVRLRDLAGLYGFRFDLGNLKVRYTTTATGEYEQIGYNGFEQGTYTASAINHQSDLTYAISVAYDAAATAGLQTSAALTTASVAFTYKETSAYDPDGTIALAAPIPSGDLTFALDYRLVAAGGEGSAAIRFTMETTDALHYDNASCYGIDDGTIVGDLNGDADVGFTIDWSACDTYSITTRGTTAVEAVAAR